MFAFWRGGAMEQVRDGFLNKKSRREPVQSATTCVFSTLWINCQIRKTKSQSNVSDCDFGRSCDEMSEKWLFMRSIKSRCERYAVRSDDGGAAQIWTGEWRFCRPLPYHLATAPMKNPVFSMLSRFSCVSIITQNCSGTKVCFVQTFVPKSLFSAVRIGGNF